MSETTSALALVPGVYAYEKALLALSLQRHLGMEERQLLSRVLAMRGHLGHVPSTAALAKHQAVGALAGLFDTLIAKELDIGQRTVRMAHHMHALLPPGIETALCSEALAGYVQNANVFIGMATRFYFGDVDVEGEVAALALTGFRR